MTWRDRLRALPVFTDDMPPVDEELPADPMGLASRWLDVAIDAAILQPHAATWTSVDADGQPSSRTLIIKDLTPEGFWFATPSTSRMGRDLAERPAASIHFYWPALGRQLQALGDAVPGPSEVSAADWAARSESAKAGAVEQTWSAYVLRPRVVEFFAASADRGHLRAEYLLEDSEWVPPTRFERATSSSGGKRSIH